MRSLNCISAFMTCSMTTMLSDRLVRNCRNRSSASRASVAFSPAEHLVQEKQPWFGRQMRAPLPGACGRPTSKQKPAYRRDPPSRLLRESACTARARGAAIWSGHVRTMRRPRCFQGPSYLRTGARSGRSWQRRDDSLGAGPSPSIRLLSNHISPVDGATFPAMSENRRGLAGAIGAHQADDFSDLHVERNIVQGPDPAEATRHAFHLQQGQDRLPDWRALI